MSPWRSINHTWPQNKFKNWRKRGKSLLFLRINTNGKSMKLLLWNWRWRMSLKSEFKCSNLIFKNITWNQEKKLMKLKIFPICSPLMNTLMRLNLPMLLLFRTLMSKLKELKKAEEFGLLSSKEKAFPAEPSSEKESSVLCQPTIHLEIKSVSLMKMELNCKTMIFGL